jgi:hypothetical protein
VCDGTARFPRGVDGNAAHFEAKRLAGEPFERHQRSRRGPQLELRVAGGPQLQQVVVAAVVELEAGDRLRVAAIEALGETQHRGKRSHRPPHPARQTAESFVLALRLRLAVVARDQRNRLDFVWLEAAQIAVHDQIVGVLVVALVADMHADVVEERGVLEPFALAIGEAVDGARLIEQREREPRDVLRVLGPVVAALGELEDAAAADVGIAIGLRDFLAVARNVVEDQPLAQRQIAERDFVGAEPAEDFIEQDRARYREIDAARLETGDAHPPLDVERDQLFAHAVDLLR